MTSLSPQPYSKWPALACVFLALGCLLATKPTFADAGTNEYPNYEKLWVGNTFGADGGWPWIQNFISAIAVGPDGRVYTNSDWDEARGHTNVYQNGTVVTRCETDRTVPGRTAASNTSSLFLGRDTWVYEYDFDCNRKGEPFQTGFVPTGLGADERWLAASDGPGNRVVIYSVADRSAKSTVSVPSPGAVAVAPDGLLWVVTNVVPIAGGWGALSWEGSSSALPSIIGVASDGSVVHTISGPPNWLPVSLSIDDTYRLVVADEGVGHHIVRFFALGDTPTQVDTFGEPGGIASGVPGQVTPTKFWGLVGAGTDAQGNLYVAMSQQGTLIRAFSPSGALRWEVMGLAFCDNADFVPGSNGLHLYSAQERYSLDFSQPRGKHWHLDHYTLNKDKYPEDVRLHGGWGPVKVRRIQDRLFLFVTNFKNDEGIYYYKFNFETDGHIAIPSGRLFGTYSGRPDWHIDETGDVWFIDDLTVGKRPLLGVDANGDLSYGAPEYVQLPDDAYTGRLGIVEYDKARDAMYIGGGTNEHPLVGCCHSGPVLSRYDNWSTSPILRWRIVVPFNNDSALPPGDKVKPQGLALAGDKLFIPYNNTDGTPAPGYGMSGVIRVYDSMTGEWLGRLFPPEAGGSWIDIIGGGGINAVQRSNGEILVVREENWKAKHIVYRLDTAGEGSSSSAGNSSSVITVSSSTAGSTTSGVVTTSSSGMEGASLGTTTAGGTSSKGVDSSSGATGTSAGLSGGISTDTTLSGGLDPGGTSQVTTPVDPDEDSNSNRGSSGCGCCANSGPGDLALVALGLVVFARRRSFLGQTP